MDKIIAFIAFALFAGFLFILGYTVPHLNLIGIITLTVVLAAIDLARSLWIDPRRK